MYLASKEVFVASRLPKRAGVSGWVATLAPRVPCPALSGSITADIAIIGAGFAGLSAARRISRLDPSARVAILEAGIVGEGPAGANSGFIIDLPHEVSADDFNGEKEDKFRQSVLIQRSAIALAADMAGEYGWGKEIFDPCGRYSVAMSPNGDKHLTDYAGRLHKMGEDHRLLSATDIASVTGSSAYTSGLFMPGTIIVQPAAYIRAVADALVDPIRLHERTPALSFERYGRGWLVKAPQGRCRRKGSLWQITAMRRALASSGGVCCMSSHTLRFPKSSIPRALAESASGLQRPLYRWERLFGASTQQPVTEF